MALATKCFNFNLMDVTSALLGFGGNLFFFVIILQRAKDNDFGTCRSKGAHKRCQMMSNSKKKHIILITVVSRINRSSELKNNNKFKMFPMCY